MAKQKPVIGIIMGSQSDWETMRHAAQTLDELGVGYEAKIVSAHRTPLRMVRYAEAARGRGLKAIVAGAGGAAHLPGMTASLTTLPVFGVPVESAALKGMVKRRWGRIVNITSIVGVTGNPGQANYAAAKAGLIGMSKALAQEVAARGITVNCVAPGFIDTAMTRALDEKQREALLGRIPAGRLGDGADIAAGVVYLASQEAAYVTGQTLHINGGMAMI